MKKTIVYTLLLLFFACNERFDSQTNAYHWELQLIITEEATVGIDSMQGIEVTFSNKYKDYEITGTSDSNGLVTIEAIEAGIYIIDKFKSNALSIYLNGYKELAVIANQKDSIIITPVFVQEKGKNFVIREYYYSGSLSLAGKQYIDDQYLEIYNNGPDTLYADSLLLVEAESYGNGADYWQYMHSDSLVVKMIWALPSISGDNFPIAPGTGFIMAIDPMDHKSDPNGNPNSPVDLANAEFDFWSNKTPDGDVDFAAPNLVPKLWVNQANVMNFHNRGGSAIAVIKLEGNVDDYITNNLITKGQLTSRSKKYCKISNHDVIDALEVTWNDKIYKRIPASLDAGATAVRAGARSGLCVRRKIERKIGDRVIYMDTNNSTVDFEHDVVPMPKVYE